MKKAKLVLIGNGMAGVRTLELQPHPAVARARRRDAGQDIILNGSTGTPGGITLHRRQDRDRIDRVRRVVIADGGGPSTTGC